MDDVVHRIEAEHPGTIEIRKGPGPGGEGWAWEIQPRASAASPIWIIGKYWNDATVGFGRSSGRIELWQLGKTEAPAAAANLERVVRAVVEGRLTERRQDARSCQYEITWSDGTKSKGRANSLFRRRWRVVEHFQPYDS